MNKLVQNLPKKAYGRLQTNLDAFLIDIRWIQC